MKVNSGQKAPVERQQRGGIGLVDSSIRARNPRSVAPPDGRAENLRQREAQNAIHPPNAGATQGLAHTATGTSLEQLSLQKATGTRVTPVPVAENKVEPRTTEATASRASKSTASNPAGRSLKTDAKTPWDVPTAREKLEKLKRNLESLRAEEADCRDTIMALVGAFKDEASIKAEGLNPRWNDDVQEQVVAVNADLAAVRLKITAALAQLAQAKAAPPA
jgi:hypothetical protein